MSIEVQDVEFFFQIFVDIVFENLPDSFCSFRYQLKMIFSKESCSVDLVHGQPFTPYLLSHWKNCTSNYIFQFPRDIYVRKVQLCDSCKPNHFREKGLIVLRNIYREFFRRFEQGFSTHGIHQSWME